MIVEFIGLLLEALPTRGWLCLLAVLIGIAVVALLFTGTLFLVSALVDLRYGR